MMLTKKQKQQADELELTDVEMSTALRMGIAPETYARHKQEIAEEREAEEARQAAFGAKITESLEREKRAQEALRNRWMEQ